MTLKKENGREGKILENLKFILKAIKNKNQSNKII